MATADKAVTRKFEQMKQEAAVRVREMEQVRRVRDGEIELLFPEFFNDKFRKSMAANFVDVVARDLAEVIAPLPALSCAAGQMKTDADKRRSAKKNKIGQYYWRCSRLAVQMFRGADWYNTYGFMPVRVEPDFDRQIPCLFVEDPIGCYYENDRWGCTQYFARVWKDTAGRLASMFPDYAHQIMDSPTGLDTFGTELEVVRFEDRHRSVLFIPQRENLVLVQTETLTDGCPVQVAERPSLNPGKIRGQFDDIIWVQLARTLMMNYSLELTHKSLRAPIAVPRDMNSMGIGDESIMRTDNPEKIRRVQLDPPVAAFQMDAQLDNELRMGARYPDARSGQMNASVVTGRGVEALMGTFDTQIKTAQTMMGEVLIRATSMCFQLDEKLWPNVTKHIHGTLNGESYDLSYTPSKDINGNYECDVTYGFAAGMSPQNAVVMMLQLRGDGDISRDTLRRQLPFAIDVEHEQEELDVQEVEDALKQALAAYTETLAPIAAQGGDPSQQVARIAAVIQGRRQGRDLADVVAEVFAPQPQPAQAAAPAAPGQPGGQLPGFGPNGLPEGTAAGQAAQGPGGAPDVQSFIAGLRAGRPVLNATVNRRIPTG